MKEDARTLETAVEAASLLTSSLHRGGKVEVLEHLLSELDVRDASDARANYLQIWPESHRELFSLLKPESGLGLRIRIELFAEGSVIKREAEKLGQDGHSSHFDSLLRDSLARRISHELYSAAATEESKRRGCSVKQLPVELNCQPHELASRLGVSVADLSDKGICPSMFEFSYIGHRRVPEGGREGNPPVDIYSYHTRFPGGEAKLQINWRSSDWGCTCGVASFRFDPSELG